MNRRGLLFAVLALGFGSSLQADSTLVFSEVMYHPAASEPTSEWIELRNELAVDLDISGWSISGGIDYLFAQSTYLRGGGYIVVAISPATLTAATGVTNVVGPYSGRLSNSGETLVLRDNSGRVVDELAYGVDGDWPVAADGAGVSLAKRDPDLPSGPASSWAASAQIGGTPGGENFPLPSAFVPPPGLVSYWNFDEPSGQNAVDRLRRNSGVLGSGAVRQLAAIGNALEFDGSSNAFVNTGLGFTNSYAVAAGITIETLLAPGWSGTNTACIFARVPRRPQPYAETILANQPVAYWRLHERDTNILDSTANAHPGTASAGVLLNQPGLIPTDPLDTAMRATANERIRIPGFEKIGAGGYSVEFWVYPQVLPSGCCLNLVGDGESASDFFLMTYILGAQSGTTSGLIRAHYGPDNAPVSLDSLTPLRTGRPYHVVTTWDTSTDNNNAAIYINGMVDRLGSVTRNLPLPTGTGSNTVFIGADARQPGAGSMTYDEVALYDFPLSAEQVAQHFAAATLTNFNRTLGNPIQLALQNDGAGPVLSFGLTLNGTYAELDMPLDGQAGRPTLAALQDGQLHHLAASYDSLTGLKAIYVDGLKLFSTVTAGTINANNNASGVIGNSEPNGNAAFVGRLDEMAFWNRALSDSEITAHVAAIRAGNGYFSSKPPPAPLALAFNEVSASTNATFWIELINRGTNTVPLNGVVIAHNGSVRSEFVFPAGTSLAANGLIALTNNLLGFRPVAGDKLYLLPPGRDAVLDAIIITAGARARSSPGTGPWLIPNQPTPGGANSFAVHDEIVINEILYHHQVVLSAEGLPPKESPEAWIELYNKSVNPVDLTGWKVAGGIQYAFEPGRILPPDGYLVVAANAAALRQAYPGIEIVGDFSGRLSHRTDRIVLQDPTGNPADEVTYFDAGHWPEYPDGGGSSLELIDPQADNSKATVWAASDESGRSTWQTYQYRMLAGSSAPAEPDAQWRDLVMGLLGAGECLIDDISVRSPTNNAVEMISNGDFEKGLADWRVIGTHGGSRVEVDPDNAGNHVLHLVATGAQEHMHNHVEHTLVANRPVTSTQTYEISFRARWLAGNNLLNTRLYFNRVAKSSSLPIPTRSGTPGARNSRRIPNAGPTFDRFGHTPVVPISGERVTVSVEARDPQGVNAAEIWWSASGGPWASAPMTALGNDNYQGVIPGFSAGVIVQFYVRAVDGLGAAAMYPPAGPDSGAVYSVADGQADLRLGHNIRIVPSPARTALLHAFTNVMSNDNLPCTVIYDEKRAYYDMGVRLKGSERGRYQPLRTSYHLEFRPDDLFRGVHPVMLIDRSGAGDQFSQQEILIRHILKRAGNIPGTQPDMCRVIAPLTSFTGSAIFAPRHEDEFVETAFANGGDGTLWELELIYFPTTTNAFGYKNPSPDSVAGLDISDQGNDKERYRYNFIIKNHRDRDDYQPFIGFAKSFSVTAPANLEVYTRRTMDLDEWARAFALVSLCGVGDSYTFGNNHNLLMYLRPSDQRMLAFPWDMDFSFNRGSGESLIGDQRLSIILALPSVRRCLFWHALDIISSAYNTSYMNYWVAHYKNFAPGQDYSAVLPYIQQRIASVVSQVNSGGGNAPFNVGATNFFVTSNSFLTVTGTAPVQVSTIRVNGEIYPVTWTTVAGWALRLPLSSETNQFTIEGYDRRGNIVPNSSRSIMVRSTSPPVDPAGLVVINEVMFNRAFPEAAYVEVFNSSSNRTFDLSGWRLDGVEFTFPPGTVLTNLQSLVVAKSLSAYLRAYGTATVPAQFEFPGELNPDGETITLRRPGPAPGEYLVVDKMRYEPGPPWPEGPTAIGSALQLIDPSQNHGRVGNWSDGTGWRFFSLSTNAGAISTEFLVFLASAGDVYIDDLTLVSGLVPGAGTNYLTNGDFETGSLEPWQALGNHAASTVSGEVAHSGSYSLHVVSSGVGGPNQTVSQVIPALVATTNYTFSFWYHSSTNGSGISFRSTLVFRSRGILDYRGSLLTPGLTNAIRLALPPFPALWLNEVQAESTTGPADAQGEHEPWLELYNAGSTAIALEGYALANNYSNLAQWPFPPGASIAPGEFKIIYADGEPAETSATEWHTSFRLEPGHGAVVLAWLPADSLQVLDYLNYTNLAPNRSYGDFPDGEPFDRQTFTPSTPATPNDGTPEPPAVIINEWMASNSSTLLNPLNGNNADDWIELYNPGANAVELGGFFVTDALENKFQFRIPPGFRIAPRGYLLLWADGLPGLNDTNRSEVHLPFQLSREGESIGLFRPDGAIADLVSFGAQSSDVSEGRYPDGAARMVTLSRPTPRAANATPRNNAPRLNTISDLVAYPGETVTFAALGTDVDQPEQSLRYSLDLYPPGASIDPVSGMFSWTPAFSQAPSTNLVRLRATDNGQPNLSITQPFNVIVLRLPQATYQSARRGVQFEVLSNRTYTIEWRESLDYGRWTKLRDALARPTNRVELLADAYPLADTRLYRLVTPRQPDPVPVPLILRSPRSRVLEMAADTELSVFAVGTGALAYQWWFNDSPIPGATRSNLVIASVQMTNMGSYAVVVTDQSGSITNRPLAILAVNPFIEEQPEDAQAAVGENASFSVAATGQEPLRYRWWHNGMLLSAQTGPVLQLINVQPREAGFYRVAVSHQTPLGTVGVWSRTATLIVK